VKNVIQRDPFARGSSPAGTIPALDRPENESKEFAPLHCACGCNDCLGGGKVYAKWYIGFVSNAITFVYTDKSKGASKINSDNWYRVLAEPGVEIGRSNPDTDPSGYQTLQMLQLAETY
jgi:hypothetical protein